MGRVDPAASGFWNSTRRPTATSPVVATRPASKLGSGNLRDAGALRLPARARDAHARGLGHQHEANLPHLQGLGPAAQEKDAEATSEGEAAGRPEEAVGPNDVWAMDFVHDQLATGKEIRVLTVVDTHGGSGMSISLPLCPAFASVGVDRGHAVDATRSLEKEGLIGVKNHGLKAWLRRAGCSTNTLQKRPQRAPLSGGQ